MQLPEQPLPPLAPLWDRALRAQALPPDVDVQRLYFAIRDRLIHPEWEVRLNALRVLADLLPLSRNALAFPFDQVIDNLGHGSPNVRKAALDALKVFCIHCEDTDCAIQSILDKCCSYDNSVSHDYNIKANVITGILLSVPSIIGTFKKRNIHIDMLNIFISLGDKLLDRNHQDVALRSLLKIRRICGTREFFSYLNQLEYHVQNRFHTLCDAFDEDSIDVYYAPRKLDKRELGRNQYLGETYKLFNNSDFPVILHTESSSDDSNKTNKERNSKVIIETEIKFDADTAITMVVLEGNQTETDSDKTGCSEDDSSERNLKYTSEEDLEDDVVVKKVRFGGESVKIRTPDSENQLTSEDENTLVRKRTESFSEIIPIKNKPNVSENTNMNKSPKSKRSNIPLPVLNNKNKTVPSKILMPSTSQKQKSKSLNELYDYFKSKNSDIQKPKEESSFSLNICTVNTEKSHSPIQSHREVEVLHNLQRSPSISPKRRSNEELNEQKTVSLQVETSGYKDPVIMSPRPVSPLHGNYEWEKLGVVPEHVAKQLHITENWIATVKAADLLHNALLEQENITKIEPAALSLVQHMMALGEAVPAARAPAEGVICVLFRSASNDCARQLLPTLMARIAKDPPPPALPHALLQRLTLHDAVDLIFDSSTIKASGDREKLLRSQLKAAFCLAQAAGPAALIAAARARLIGDMAEQFCTELRELLNKPGPETSSKQIHSRTSHLPVPLRRRARSTPPAASTLPKLRTLPESAPNISYKKEVKLTLSSPVRDATEVITVRIQNGNQIKREEVTHDNNTTNNESPLHRTLNNKTPENENEEEKDSCKTSRRSSSVHIEDYSDSEPIRQTDNIKERHSKNEEMISNNPQHVHTQNYVDEVDGEQTQTPLEKLHESCTSSVSSNSQKSNASSPRKSRASTPTLNSYQSSICERDVRLALSECIVPPKHEDWEVIVNALLEIERLAGDVSAKAPTVSWRTVVRSASAHVRSLRSRVARTACVALGSLFEHRGRILDTELEEAASALLERCADVNRFIRADATEALIRITRGSNIVRAALALVKRGTTHRAGPVRAAATQGLAKLVQYHGSATIFDLQPETRALILRTAGEMLADAHPETRQNARNLCLALADDSRFKTFLRDSMSATRFKAIEKYLEKLYFR